MLFQAHLPAVELFKADGWRVVIEMVDKHPFLVDLVNLLQHLPRG